MPIIACTIFERHYHNGVAALTNSLYRHGYRGSVYAGYRGDLPAWSSSAKEGLSLNWAGASTLEVADGLTIHFLPIDSEFHLMFYKPRLMQYLLENSINCSGIAYFDPDIIVKCKWEFFEKWISYGVALVQESSNMPSTHPLRKEWETVINLLNRKVVRENSSYYNSGFCGVSKENAEFLLVWQQVIETAIKSFNLIGKRGRQTYDKTYLFFNNDQDALNIVAMCCRVAISEIGPEGMDFISGGFTMSHALGSPKPWNKKFIRLALKAKPPTLADKWFWENVKSPISLYSKSLLIRRYIAVSIASLIGRFYRRS